MEIYRKICTHVSLEFDRTSFPQRRTEAIGTRYVAIEIKCNAFITIQHIMSHIIYYIFLLLCYCIRSVYGVQSTGAGTKFTRVKGYLGAYNIRSYKYIIFHAWNIEWCRVVIFYSLPFHRQRSPYTRTAKRFADAICFDAVVDREKSDLLLLLLFFYRV